MTTIFRRNFFHFPSKVENLNLDEESFLVHLNMLNILVGKEKKMTFSLKYEVSSELNINLCKFNINTSMLKIFVEMCQVWYKAKFKELSNFIIFLQYKNSIDNYFTSCLKLLNCWLG